MVQTVLCERLGPPESLVFRDHPVPPVGPRDVHLRVRAAGVNFPDTLIIQGQYQVRPELPFAPGSEAAGDVLAVGSEVEHVRVGDRVCAFTGFGAFAEEAVVDQGRVAKIPDAMDYPTAAGFTVTYATTWFALRERAKIQAGESLLVLGAAGGVGLTAVQLGKALGARVIAAASTPEKLALVTEHGADETINYREEDLNGRLKELVGARGLDVVYDPVGGPATDVALRRMAWNGRLLVIGFASGKIPAIRANLVLVKNCDVLGVHWGVSVDRDPAGHRTAMAELFELWAQDRLRPLVSETFPLAAAPEALQYILDRRARGKVVLTCD